MTAAAIAPDLNHFHTHKTIQWTVVPHHKCFFRGYGIREGSKGFSNHSFRLLLWFVTCLRLRSCVRHPSLIYLYNSSQLIGLANGWGHRTVARHIKHVATMSYKILNCETNCPLVNTVYLLYIYNKSFVPKMCKSRYTVPCFTPFPQGAVQLLLLIKRLLLSLLLSISNLW